MRPIQRIKNAIAATTTLALIGVAGATTASAATPAIPSDTGVTISDEDLAAYAEIFTDQGISQEVQAGLFDKISSGQPLDADDPASVPASTEPSTHDGFPAEKITFDDGSVVIRYSEVPTDSAAPGTGASTMGFGTTDCAAQNNGGFTQYTYCRIVYDGASFSYSFRADFRVSNLGTSHISNAYEPVIHRAVAHGTSAPRVEVIRENATATLPAYAKMSFEATAIYVLWTRTFTADLSVRTGSFSVGGSA